MLSAPRLRPSKSASLPQGGRISDGAAGWAAHSAACSGKVCLSLSYYQASQRRRWLPHQSFFAANERSHRMCHHFAWRSHCCEVPVREARSARSAQVLRNVEMCHFSFTTLIRSKGKYWSNGLLPNNVFFFLHMCHVTQPALRRAGAMRCTCMRAHVSGGAGGHENVRALLTANESDDENDSADLAVAAAAPLYEPRLRGRCARCPARAVAAPTAA